MIVIADTSICSSNTGDQIIVSAAREAVRPLTDRYGLRSIPTHTGMGYRGRRILEESPVALLAGTNLLSAHVGPKQQWRTLPLRSRHRRFVSFGCGFGSGEDRPTKGATSFLRATLDSGALHAARDRFSADLLQELGFRAIYTGCPTMWMVDREAPEAQPVPEDRCVVILNRTLRRPDLDRLVLRAATSSFAHVRFWCQAPFDRAYLTLLPANATEIPPSLQALAAELRTHPGAQVLTTRLHAAIYSQWFGHRPHLIAVDIRSQRAAGDAGMTWHPVPTTDLEMAAILHGPPAKPASPPPIARAEWLNDLAYLVATRVDGAARRVTAEPGPLPEDAPATPRSAPTRVLWLAKCIGIGGVERLLVSMARELDLDRHMLDVAFVTPADDRFVTELESVGATVHDLSRRFWPLHLLRLLSRGRYDVVHSQSPLPGVVARLGRRRFALLHTEHNRWSAYHSITRWASRITISRNDVGFAVSHAVADSMQGARFRRASAPEVLYHGFDDAATVVRDPTTRKAARRQLGLADEDVVVGTVGNLRRSKDHANLLAAVSQLRNLEPDLPLRVLLVGEGPLRRALEEQIQSLALTDVARLLGSRLDVRQLLPAFDAYAISSMEEGLPLALLEALAAGLPVVTTTAGGILEVVDEDTAEIVPIANARALCDGLRRVLTDQSRAQRLATGGPLLAAGFSTCAAVRRLEAVYEELVGGTGRGIRTSRDRGPVDGCSL